MILTGVCEPRKQAHSTVMHTYITSSTIVPPLAVLVYTSGQIATVLEVFGMHEQPC
jgi:hypothetical protein